MTRCPPSFVLRSWTFSAVVAVASVASEEPSQPVPGPSSSPRRSAAPAAGRLQMSFTASSCYRCGNLGSQRLPLTECPYSELIRASQSLETLLQIVLVDRMTFRGREMAKWRHGQQQAIPAALLHGLLVET